MKQGVAFLVISIAPARSEAKLSRSRLRRHHRQPLPGRGGADPHMPEPISVLLSAYATPSIAAAATGSAPPCDACSWVRP